MRVLVLMAIVLACHTANAEVFKCVGKGGKTVYQAKPCQTTDKAQQLDIQADPAQEAAAKAKLEALQNEHEAKKAARLEAERNDAVLRNQTESTTALKQSAFAQQQQVAAEQRQAAALERQARQYGNPAVIIATPPTAPRMTPPDIMAPKRR